MSETRICAKFCFLKFFDSKAIRNYMQHTNLIIAVTNFGMENGFLQFNIENIEKLKAKLKIKYKYW